MIVQAALRRGSLWQQATAQLQSGALSQQINKLLVIDIYGKPGRGMRAFRFWIPGYYKM